MVIKARTGGMHNESLMEFAWEASAYTAHVNLLVDLPDSRVFFPSISDFPLLSDSYHSTSSKEFPSEALTREKQ